MSDAQDPSLNQSNPHSATSAGEADNAKRQRMKPGERRTQILQMLAQMLEQPGAERVTTALLASKLGVSEAALYRHFASKAQMFEGLIDFIEQAVFTLINQIADKEGDGAHKAAHMVTVLLQFGEKTLACAVSWWETLWCSRTIACTNV